MRCRHSLVGAHRLWWVSRLPNQCACSRDGLVGGWRGDWSCCCRGIPQRTPEGIFLFGKILLLNPAAPSIQGRACPLTQPTSPARPGTEWVRVPHGPTLNSPQPAPTVSVGLPLHPYSPPWDFKQPGLSWCCSSLVGSGVAAALVPVFVPGTFFVLKQSPYLLFFQCPLYFLVSYLHKPWGAVGCLLHSSVDWVGVSLRCRGKLTQLPPTCHHLPYSILIL